MVQEKFDSELFEDAAEQKEVEELFNTAVKAPPGPVGTFQVDITDAILERSQSSNRIQIHYELVILVGPHKDTILHKYDGLDKDVSVRIAGQELRRLGINLQSLTFATLPAHLVKLKGQRATITAKQKGDFYNINFVKLLLTVPGVSGSVSGPAPAATAGPRKF